MNTSDSAAAQVKRRTAAPLQPHHFANAERTTTAQLLATPPSASQPLEETASALLDKLAAPSDGYMSSGNATAPSSPRATGRRLRGSLGRLCNGLLRRLRLSKALGGHSGSQLLRFGLMSLITAVVVFVVHLCAMEKTISLDGSSRELQYLRQPSTTPWSVLVEHDTAMERLGIPPQRECHGDEDLRCTPMRVGPAFLPSWTLRVVNPACADCLDVGSYAAALNSTPLQGRQHGVFATSAAPLGRIGPMLLAMASVTDDVDVRAELPRWTWLRSVYGESFPRVPAAAEEAGDAATAGAPAAAQGPPAPSYLAVMGIPSTDQPQRVAQRDAQRATWLSYREVARTANDFRGALLPLYLFAAVEPEVAAAAADQRDARHPMKVIAAARAEMQEELRLLLPTTVEWESAVAALAGAQADTEGHAPAAQVDEEYAQRRFELREDWRRTMLELSPCGQVTTTTARADDKTSAVSYLHEALSLPVQPPFTSPSEFICFASAALWQEALTHRNVIWVDLMTDRRPTTDKKIGETNNWGMPVEVGMSQKLILWLEYAYHAFPNVPYIMKGDDDAYLKVPQYLSDLRTIMKEHKTRPPLTPVGEREPPGNASGVRCLYWGSLRGFGGVRFSAGMTFTLHRQMVHGMLEPHATGMETDAVLFTMAEFNPKKRKLYRATHFQSEDILVGVLLRNREARVTELCPGNAVWYAKEGRPRYHDMRRGKVHDVTWATVVAHRASPADFYFLHHFFETEHLAARAAAAGTANAESAAATAAATWMANKYAQLGWPSNVTSAPPPVQWTGQAATRPAHEMAAGENVAVYSVGYSRKKRQTYLVANTR